MPSPRSSRGLLLCLAPGFPPPQGSALGSSIPGRHFIKGVTPTLPITPHQPLLPDPASFSLGYFTLPKTLVCSAWASISLRPAGEAGRVGPAGFSLMLGPCVHSSACQHPLESSQTAKHKGWRDRPAITSSVTLPTYSMCLSPFWKGHRAAS